MFMLTARVDETKCIKEKMEIKLGYNSYRRINNGVAEESASQNPENDNCENSIHNDSEPTDSTAVPLISASEQSLEDRSHFRSIKPPQATLPKFYGNAEDFPEYWAIFETLVHKSKELDIMEKIMLLKESLKGRAQTSIKGIKLIPENYTWFVKTLQQNYSDQPTNRSQIV